MKIGFSFCIFTFLGGIAIASCCSPKDHGHGGYKIDYSALDGLDASKHPTLRDKIKQVLIEHYEQQHKGNLHGGWSAKAPIVLSTGGHKGFSSSDFEGFKGHKGLKDLGGYGLKMKGHGHALKSHGYGHALKSQGYGHGHGHGHGHKSHGYYSDFGNEDDHHYNDHPSSSHHGHGEEEDFPSAETEYQFKAFPNAPSDPFKGTRSKHPYWNKYRDMSELEGY